MPETQGLFWGSSLLLAVKICAPYATYFTAEALRTLRGSLKMKTSANSVASAVNPVFLLRKNAVMDSLQGDLA